MNIRLVALTKVIQKINKHSDAKITKQSSLTKLIPILLDALGEFISRNELLEIKIYKSGVPISRLE